MDARYRIKKLLEYSGLNVSQFAVKIGAKTPQGIRDILNGRTNGISDSMKRKILSCFSEINPVWLLTGEGEMLLPAINQDVTGDNNTSVAGNGNHVNSTPTSLIEEIAAQRKLTEAAQEHLSKAQEQMDRLIAVIEKLTAK